MRRVLCLLVPVLMVLQFSVFAYNGDTKVYITNTGECYHRGSCGYLHSKHEVTLEEAVERGYRACTRCRPTKLEGARPNQGAVESSSQPSEISALVAEGNSVSPFAILYVIPIGVLFWEFFGDGIKKYRDRHRSATAERYLQTKAGKEFLLQSYQAGYKTGFAEGAERERQKVDCLIQQLDRIQNDFSKEQSGYTSSQDDVLGAHILASGLETMYGGKRISELAKAPKSVCFDAKGYPHTHLGDSGTDLFEVYLNAADLYYHRSDCRISPPVRQINVCAAIELGLNPCPVCCPRSEIPKFASEYRRLEAMCRRYDVSIEA